MIVNWKKFVFNRKSCFKIRVVTPISKSDKQKKENWFFFRIHCTVQTKILLRKIKLERN